MAKARLIKRGGKIILRKEAPTQPTLVRPEPTPRREEVFANPEQFYHTAVKDPSVAPSGVAYLAGQSAFNLFAVDPDADEIYGNYSRAYLDRPAHLSGIKVDILPENSRERQTMNPNYNIDYFSDINRIMSGTVSLMVNKYPIYQWKVDDIGPTAKLSAEWTQIPEVDPIVREIIFQLHAPKFTIFSDLISSNLVRTKGKDAVYLSFNLIEPLSSSSVMQNDFMVKGTLLLRPVRTLPGVGEIRRIARPGVGEEEDYAAIEQQIGGNRQPYVYYHVLRKSNLISDYDGRTIEFYALRPDANALYANYPQEKIRMRMTIQGIKLGFYPFISTGSANDIYPQGRYGFLIELFRKGTFQLIVNKMPVYTWKGAELLSGITPEYLIPRGGSERWVYITRSDNYYLIFKDFVSAQKLNVGPDDDVWVRCKLPAPITNDNCPEDFMVKASLLCSVQQKPIRV